MGVCVVDHSYSIITSKEVINTPEDMADSGVMIQKIFSLLDDVVKSASEKLNKDARLAAVGVGCPGQSEDGVLVAASNFPGWKNVHFAEMITNKYGIPATLLNGGTGVLKGDHNIATNSYLFLVLCVAYVDVDAALAAEYWGQPAQYGNVKHMVMVALGTGVGYAVIVDGKQLFGHFGLLEGGHMIINPTSNLLCGCGQYGESVSH